MGIAKLADDKPNPNYSPTRAFWLEPSYNRLLKAGLFFDDTMLQEKQRDLESKGADPVTGKMPQIKRFPIPEFDAMRALLNKGLIVPKTLAAPARPWDLKNAPLIARQEAAVFNWAYQQIKLPPAKPSWFKNANDIASPKVSADAISAQFDIAWSLQVTKPRYWSENGINGVGMIGAWDIGNVSQQLAQPIYTVAVDGTGRILTAKSRMQTAGTLGEDPSGCTFAEHIAWPTDSGIPTWPAKNELPPLMRLMRPLPFTQAKISVKKQAMVHPKNLVQTVKFVRASMTGIDLDGDGVDDVAVWKAITRQFNEPGASTDDYPFTMIFVNVQASWLLLEHALERVEVCD